MSVDRTPRDCQHPRANHQHGTRTAYVLDRCRCRPCHDAAIVEILYGKGSSDPKERRPPRKRVRPDIAARILAVKLDLADGAMVDGTGTRRRLQALVAIGYSQQSLGRRIGWSRGHIGTLVHGAHPLVVVATRKLVAELYDELSLTPAPYSQSSARARNYARRAGWPPPLAWDDDEIDDPDAQPHVDKPTLPGGGRPWADVVEDWHDTWDHHQGDITIAAARFGVTVDGIQKAFAKAKAAGVTVRRSITEAVA